MVSEEMVKAIRDRLNIVSVLRDEGLRVKALGKSEKSARADCPRCKAKVRAFVKVDRGFIHCHLCGYNDSAIGVVMLTRGISFAYAVNHLYWGYGLDVSVMELRAARETEKKSWQKEKEELIRALDRCISTEQLQIVAMNRLGIRE